ncbi:AMP-binding protein, partial [Acinetobacter baumannii]
MTYQTLWNQVLLIAQAIMHYNFSILHQQKSGRIAILMQRDQEMIITILATLISGHAYVPIDPDYPSDRIKLMLVDAEVSFVITT